MNPIERRRCPLQFPLWKHQTLYAQAIAARLHIVPALDAKNGKQVLSEVRNHHLWRRNLCKRYQGVSLLVKKF